ncbi:MAG: hypothetical protein WAX69_18085 [Victivallales bacterium]
MKYYYTLDEVEKMMTGKDPQTFQETFLKKYRPSPYKIFNDNAVIGAEGFSRLNKPENDFKNIDDYRLSCLENDMNIFTEMLKLQGASNKNTSCLQEIQSLRKLIAKKDLSTLVWCMPQFFFRLSRFIARPGIEVIKNKRIADKTRVKTSQTKRLAKSEPLREKYLSVYDAEKNKLKISTINKLFRNWCWENQIPGNQRPDTKTLNRWRKTAGHK